MNKTAAVFHWIVFIVLAAMALIYIFSADLEIAEYKGAWQLSYLRAFQASEKNLLFLDQEMTQNAEKVAKNLPAALFSSELGCGMYESIAVWNKKSDFCLIEPEKKFVEAFKALLGEKEAMYSNFTVGVNEIVGISQNKSIVGSSLDLIPTERRSATWFTSYDAFTIKPFYLKYEYAPSFRVKVNLSFEEYKELEVQAKKLVGKCQNEPELKSCLEQNKNKAWKLGSCGSESYSNAARKVLFCTLIKAQETKFALDFTSEKVSPPSDVDAEAVADGFLITFPQNELADSYVIHYTDWSIAPQKVPNTADNIFFGVPTFNLYQQVALIPPADENCPVDKLPGETYLCSGKINYILDDAQLTSGMYVGVAAVKDGVESQINEFVVISS
ncbi:hypothetical protein HZC30_00545 [Candidatus Woesearchaeota archaeon]|nr:hypothetical protein [Candidatus Woesearchaeota archaeon]